MRKRRIEILKSYKKMLLEYKRIQLSNELSMGVENKSPLNYKPKQKVLTIFR